MLKALGLKSAEPSVDNFTQKLAILQNAVDLENGLRAMDLVMDDRPDEGQKILKTGKSTYYSLAQGVIHFIEATLGFEPEAIKQAVDSLHEAEQSSSKDRQKAQKLNIKSSSLPPGAEYALTLAEANLMGAIALFLSESVLDAAKAFLRLRKAYQILDELNNQIHNHAHGNNLTSALSHVSTKLEKTHLSPVEFTPEQSKIWNAKLKAFENARKERLSKTKNSNTSSVTLTPDEDSASTPSQPSTPLSTSPSDYIAATDEFIISGVNCMFGLLQLILSIIPPTLGKVMSLVGFRGDRETGLRMLWKAANYSNIHGAIALLALLQFYDGPTQFVDIQKSHDESMETNTTASSTPTLNTSPSSSGLSALSTTSNGLAEEDLIKIKVRLEGALKRTRTFYSRGALWQLQEGRMVAHNDLVEAVKIMDDTSNGPIQMVQVEGLMLFDKTIMTCILHQYERSAEAFIRLIDLNTWSHAFYMYLAGACYVELYRDCTLKNDTTKASQFKQKAIDCLEKAPTMLGKRKFMAKAMPFDVFVLRKINHWKSIASSKHVDIVDAISTSPIHEVLYFYNGFNRMPKEYLQETLTNLGYSGKQGTPFAASSSSPPPVEESDSDALTRYLLTSVTLRALDRVKEGAELLETKVIPVVCSPITNKGLSPNGIPAKLQYHKHLSEPWSGPSAIYERAIFEWRLNGIPSAGATRDYLELAANWDEDYELSTRVSFKIKSAKDRLDSYNL